MPENFGPQNMCVDATLLAEMGGVDEISSASSIPIT